jgi:hypothetical protein
MKILITGASSGIGASLARTLSSQGHDLILVARRKKKLETLAKELNTNVQIIDMDISSTYNCMDLYNKVKKEKIDVLINNAGFGLFGKFDETKIDKELDMIDINIKTVHTLTKLFLKDFKKRDSGYILNVASIAGILPGPLMSTYYATKAYVLNLTLAINEELKKDCSNVYVGALCPGPVNTEFNEVAKVKFALKGLSSDYVSIYAVKKMFKNKKIIIPGAKIKMGYYLSKILPLNIKMEYIYKIQKRKSK